MQMRRLKTPGTGDTGWGNPDKVTLTCRQRTELLLTDEMQELEVSEEE